MRDSPPLPPPSRPGPPNARAPVQRAHLEGQMEVLHCDWELKVGWVGGWGWGGLGECLRGCWGKFTRGSTARQGGGVGEGWGAVRAAVGAGAAPAVCRRGTAAALPVLTTQPLWLLAFQAANIVEELLRPGDRRVLFVGEVVTAVSAVAPKVLRALPVRAARSRLMAFASVNPRRRPTARPQGRPPGGRRRQRQPALRRGGGRARRGGRGAAGGGGLVAARGSV